ncbi:DUF2283 domain-containing protein [Candidatus Pacearchaeota archaeon]|nr:DUF2283 domain-containing protein [Candidatus Pacearchaeota archaeon]
MKGQMNIYYDQEGDYLTIFIGDSKPNYGEDIDDDITIFKDNNTNEIVGIGILNFKERTKSLESIELKLPFSVNFSSLKV